MNLEYLLFIFVLVTALAFTIQMLSMWQAARAAKELLGRFERQSQQVERDLQVVQERLLAVTEGLKPLQRMAENLSDQAESISQTVLARTADLDKFVQEVIGVGRDQALKIDYLVTDTVQKFEQTTEVIQKDVLRPVVEISSFVKGLKTGLQALFSKQATEAAEVSPEEELFI